VLDSLPGDEPQRGGGVRTATLVVTIALLGGAVLVALAWVSGIFAGFGHTASTVRGDAPDAAAPELVCHAYVAPSPSAVVVPTPVSAQPSSTVSRSAAATSAAVSPAAVSSAGSSPTISVTAPAPVPTETVAAVTGSAAVGGGITGAGSTPLDAAVAWRDAAPVHERLIESRTYAPPAGLPGDSRTFGWYGHDGDLQALVTVVPASGGWQVSQASYCP
jgi:hypothetical protein